MREEGKALKHHRGYPLRWRQISNILTAEVNFARGYLLKAADHSQSSRFSTATGA